MDSFTTILGLFAPTAEPQGSQPANDVPVDSETRTARNLCIICNINLTTNATPGRESPSFFTITNGALRNAAPSVLLFKFHLLYLI
ncbi:unnamed protein product [Peniophora sp. CBMAI 1063]|nr:unnamed protein product [Peniophora sp. CBMAI 1063]